MIQRAKAFSRWYDRQPWYPVRFCAFTLGMFIGALIYSYVR